MKCEQCSHIWSCERTERIFYCKVTGQEVPVTEEGIMVIICPLEDRQEVKLDA
jgi:hypothetical protein